MYLVQIPWALIQKRPLLHFLHPISQSYHTNRWRGRLQPGPLHVDFHIRAAADSDVIIQDQIYVQEENKNSWGGYVGGIADPITNIIIVFQTL